MTYIQIPGWLDDFFQTPYPVSSVMPRLGLTNPARDASMLSLLPAVAHMDRTLSSWWRSILSSRFPI